MGQILPKFSELLAPKLLVSSEKVRGVLKYPNVVAPQGDFVEIYIRFMLASCDVCIYILYVTLASNVTSVHAD